MVHRHEQNGDAAGEAVTWDGRIRADARSLPIASESVQSCVTSPPYWGLRDYGQSGQIGLEATPREYLNNLREVCFEIWRVLRKDGTFWLNLGDTYAGSWGAQSRDREGDMQGREVIAQRQIARAARKASHAGSVAGMGGLKPKDLVGIPWRVAFALQEDGWYLRSDIIWHKPNPMPESVTDRPTRSHEYLFLLTKSARYYYNADAIREDTTGNAHDRGAGVNPKAYNQPSSPGAINSPHGQGFTRRAQAWPSGWGKGDEPHTTIELNQGDRRGPKESAANPKESRSSASTRMGRGAGWRSRQNESFSAAVTEVVTSRNKRSVWTISTQPYPEAHYATFPEEIPEICIKAGSRPGDLILDPFFGSGTVGRVAERLGRRWIGCDLSYQDLQKKRLLNVQKELLC